MNEQPFKQIKVIFWKSLEDKELIFINSDKSPSIYQDDKTSDAIGKLHLILNTKSRIYAWNEQDQPIEFLLKDNIEGYNVNPFLSKIKSANSEKQLSFDFFHNRLFTNEVINLTTKEFIPSQFHKYYFYDFHVPDKSTYENMDKFMNQLSSTLAVGSNDINYSKVNYIANLNVNINLIKFWEESITNKNINLVKWHYDNSKQLYKLHTKHTFTEEVFNVLKLIETTKECIILVLPIGNNNSYCVIYIHKDGTIKIEFNMNLKEKISYKIISEHIDIIEQYILKVLNYQVNSLKIVENNIACSIELHLYKGASFANISNTITKIPFFTKVSIDKNKIECYYTRTSIDTNSSIDISDLIRVRLSVGATDAQIINNLKNLDVKDDNLQILIDIVRNNGYLKTKKKIKTVGLYLVFVYNQNTNKITLNILNIPNYEELGYLLFWIKRILNFQSKTVQELKQEPKPKSKSKSSSEIEFELNSSSGGGNRGSDSRIELLQKMDPRLFDDGYSRKCQGKQPIGFTEKEYNQKYKDRFDNSVVYGSDSKTQNVYVCPRKWCPISKVPLIPLDNGEFPSCPNPKEVPINTFSDLDAKSKRFVGFNSKTNNSGLCTPCCFKKLNDKSIERCIKNITKPEKNKNNILKNVNRIPDKRIAVIPEAIHKLLNTDIDYDLCTKNNLTNNECLYRYGIKVNNQSFLTAVLTSLGISKAEFMNNILESMTFLKFISLENGEISRIFMNDKYFNRKVKIPEKWFPESMDIEGNIRDNIYKSFMSFIEYLENEKDKEPIYMYSLIALIFKKVLIVFHHNSDVPQILCPYYITYEELLFYSSNAEGIFVYLNKENTYDSLVLNSKKNLQFSVELRKYPQLSEVLKNCQKETSKYFKDIYSYQNAFSTNRKYEQLISSIVLNNDLSIDTFVLKNGIVVQLDKNKSIPSSYISKLSDLGINNIILYDSLKSRKIETKDLALIANMLKKHNLIMKASEISSNIYYYEKNKRYFDRACIFDGELIKQSKPIVDANYKSRKMYISKKYSEKMMSKNIELENNSWIFSAIGVSPNNPKEFFKVSHKVYPISKYTIQHTMPRNDISYNKSLDIYNGIKTNLSHKWNKTPFDGMSYIENKTYNNKTLISFFEDIDLNLTDMKISISDILKMKNSNILKASLKEDLLLKLLYDNSFKILITNKLNISKDTSTKSIVEKYLLPKNRVQIISEILNNTEILPNDYYLEAFSSAIDATIIILYSRSHYGTKDVKNARDFNSSFIVFFSKKYKERPVILFYRDRTPTGHHYYLLSHDNKIYDSFQEMPSRLKQFLNNIKETKNV